MEYGFEMNNSVADKGQKFTLLLLSKIRMQASAASDAERSRLIRVCEEISVNN